MKNLLKLAIVCSIVGLVLFAGVKVHAAPISNIFRTLLPEITATYDLGSVSKIWNYLYTNNICLSGDCKSAWPSSVGSGLATTSPTNPGDVLWYSGTGGGSAKGVATTTLVAGTNTSFSGGTPIIIGSSPVTINTTGGFPFTPQAGGNGTNTTLILNQGLVSVGSTTISSLGTGFVQSVNGLLSAAALTGAQITTALGFTPANQATTITLNGTANQLTSSAGAQDLSANRTWTLSLPSHVIFPGNFQATNATTSNATTTSLYIKGARTLSALLTTDSTGQVIGTSTLGVAYGGTGSTTLTGILKGNGTSLIQTAANGTDYSLISALTCGAGNHFSAVTASGTFTCSADTGSGGGWPYTTSDTNYGIAVQSTTTPEWFKNGLMASSTSYFVNASTSLLTTNTIYGGRTGNAAGKITLAATGDGQDIYAFPSNATTAGTYGGDIDFEAGTASTSGNGGTFYLYAGNASQDTNGSGVGGAFDIRAGQGGAVGGAGGYLSLNAGNAAGGNADGGSIFIAPGTKNGDGLDGTIFLYQNTSVSYGAKLDLSAIANSDKIFSFPNVTGTLGVGVATTSGSLSYWRADSGLGAIATTSATCAGTVSCSPFTILGASPITITGSGGAGASGGTWSTTTSQVPGRLINYPNNATDVVTVGGNSTTTAPIYFDKTASTSVIGTRALHIGPVNEFNNACLNGASTCVDIVADENVPTGNQLVLENKNAGTSAASAIILRNDLSTSPLSTTAGFIGFHSSTYNDTSYGTAFALPNQLILGSFAGPLTLDSSGGGEVGYINFVVNGSSAENEAARIDVSGDFLIGTTSDDSVNPGQPGQLVVDSTDAGTENIIQAYANINDFAEVNCQNFSAGNAAQCGFSATRNDGNLTGNFVWMGVNSTGFWNPTAFNVGGAGDGTILSDVNDFYFAQGTAGKSTHFLNGGVSTSTNEYMTVTGTSIYFPTLSQGSVYLGSGGLVQTKATSTPTVTAPITYSGTLGQFIGGVSGAFDCTSATLSVKGCLTSADYAIFNNKISSTSLSATFPLAYNSSTGAFTSSFSTTTNTGMSAGNLYIGSGGIMQTTASSSIFGYTPEQPLTFSSPLIRTANNVAWVGLATTTQPSSSNLLVSNGGAGVYGVATTTVGVSGALTTTAGAGSLVGGSNLTIAYTGLATSSATVQSNLFYSSGGAGVANVATTSLSVTGPFTIANPIGVLKNGAITYTGLATTSALTQGQLLYNTTAGNGVASVATTTLVAGTNVSFSGGTPVVLGSSPITINVTGSGGGGVGFASTTASTESIYYYGLGYVGIGTSTPKWLLNLATSTTQLALTNPGAGLNAKHLQLGWLGGSFNIGTSSDDFTSSSTALSITPGGPPILSVGSTSPFAQLSVHANAGQTLLNLFSVGSSTASATTTLFRVANTGQVFLYNAGLGSANTGDYLCINTSTGEVESSTATCSLSSRIYKNNIRNLNKGLTQILALRPVTFNYNELSGKDTTRENMGLIAEEVSLVLPDAVTYAKDGKPQALDWNQFIPVIVKSIQQMYVTVMAHETRIKKLEKENAALEARLNALEHEK